MLRSMLSGLCLLTLVSTAHGQTLTPSEQLFTDFSRCDAHFFESLRTARLPADTVTLASYGAVMAPKVADPLQAGGTYQRFQQPLEVNGVKLLGYYNQAQSMGKVGNFLFWGFVVEGPVKDVAARLKPLVADNSRFVAQGTGVTRVEVRRVGDPMDKWRVDGLFGPGVATPFGFIERAFMVDEGGAEPPVMGRTTVFCSLQGTVTAPLLQVYRPDLNAHLLD